MNMKKVAIMAAANSAALAFSGRNPTEESTLAYTTPNRGIPDRVSIDSQSPHFWPGYRNLGVRIDGRERLGDVHEFCVSEGWAMVRSKGPDGRPYDDGTGKFALERVEGVIRPYFKEPPPGEKTIGDATRIKAAEDKRKRKAEKLMKDWR